MSTKDATLGDKGVSGVAPAVSAVPLDDYHVQQQVVLESQRDKVAEIAKDAKPDEPIFDSARDALEDRAAKRAQERRVQETALMGGEPAPAAEPAEGEAQAAAPAPEPQQAEGETKTPRLIKVKVDGVEQTWTEDELIRRAQKAEAADQRLQQATEALRAATAITQPQRPQDQPKPAAPPKANLDTLVDDLADKVAYGDKNSIKDALKQFAETVSTPTNGAMPTEADIARIVAQQTASNLEFARTKEAYTGLYTANRDVLDDELYAAGVAATIHKEMVNDLIKIGGKPEIIANLGADQIGFSHKAAREAGYGVRSFGEIGATAIDTVRQKFNVPKPGNGAASPSPLAQRQEAKRQMTPRPNPASARVPMAPPPRKEARDLIAEEANSRVRR